MGYLFLLLAVLSLGLLGVLHKVADHRKCRPAAINLFLFLWAGFLAATFCLLRQGLVSAVRIPLWVALVAVACGTFASLAILNFQKGIRYGKISTSWLVINLSTLVPTLLSILIYKEEVSVRKSVSLMFAVAALLLLWLDQRKEKTGEDSSTTLSVLERP